MSAPLRSHLNRKAAAGGQADAQALTRVRALRPAGYSLGYFCEEREKAKIQRTGRGPSPHAEQHGLVCGRGQRPASLVSRRHRCVTRAPVVPPPHCTCQRRRAVSHTCATAHTHASSLHLERRHNLGWPSRAVDVGSGLAPHQPWGHLTIQH